MTEQEIEQAGKEAAEAAALENGRATVIEYLNERFGRDNATPAPEGTDPGLQSYLDDKFGKQIFENNKN